MRGPAAAAVRPLNWRRSPARRVRRSIIAMLGCAGLHRRTLQPQHRRPRLRPQRLRRARRLNRGRDPRCQHDPCPCDERLAHLATRPDAKPDEPVFPRHTGGGRDCNNLNRRAIASAVNAAPSRGQPLPDSISAHTFRRTFHHADARGWCARSLPPKPGRAQDATTTLSICTQVAPPRPLTPRPGVRCAHDKRRSPAASDGASAPDPALSSGALSGPKSPDRTSGRARNGF